MRPPWPSFSRCRSARLGRSCSFFGGSPSGRAVAVCPHGLVSSASTRSRVEPRSQALRAPFRTARRAVPKACALSSLTRPERFLFHDADRLVLLGGFHFTRYARCGYCVPLSCFWFRCRALRPVSSLPAEPPAFCDTIQARVPCFVSVQGGRKKRRVASTAPRGLNPAKIFSANFA